MEPPCSNPSPGVFESNSFDNLVQTLESIFKLAEGRGGGGGGQANGGGNGATGRAAGASSCWWPSSLVQHRPLTFVSACRRGPGGDGLFRLAGTIRCGASLPFLGRSLPSSLPFRCPLQCLSLAFHAPRNSGGRPIEAARPTQRSVCVRAQALGSTPSCGTHSARARTRVTDRRLPGRCPLPSRGRCTRHGTRIKFIGRWWRAAERAVAPHLLCLRIFDHAGSGGHAGSLAV